MGFYFFSGMWLNRMPSFFFFFFSFCAFQKYFSLTFDGFRFLTLFMYIPSISTICSIQIIQTLDLLIFPVFIGKHMLDFKCVSVSNSESAECIRVVVRNIVVIEEFLGFGLNSWVT